MVHVGVGMVVVAVTCVLRTLVAYVWELDVSTAFAVGSFVALATRAFLAYVVRQRL